MDFCKLQCPNENVRKCIILASSNFQCFQFSDFPVFRFSHFPLRLRERESCFLCSRFSNGLIFLVFQFSEFSYFSMVYFSSKANFLIFNFSNFLHYNFPISFLFSQSVNSPVGKLWIDVGGVIGKCGTTAGNHLSISRMSPLHNLRYVFRKRWGVLILIFHKAQTNKVIAEN